MTICPFCGHKNIEGVDVCDECGQSLTGLSTAVVSASELERSLYKDRLRMLWPRKPVCVPPSTPVAEVLKLLVNNSIGCIMIVDGEKIAGIFTERDALLKLNTEAAELGARPISDFMTPNPQMLSVNDKIVYAVQRMDLGGYRHVPLVDDNGQLVGVVSVRDILQYFMQKISTLAPKG